jgi:hypothetical protein
MRWAHRELGSSRSPRRTLSADPRLLLSILDAASWRIAPRMPETDVARSTPQALIVTIVTVGVERDVRLK